MGAFHTAQNSRNFAQKSNGTDHFRVRSDRNAKKKHDKYNTLKGAAAWIDLITSRPDRFERVPEIEPTAQVERTKDVILAWHKPQVSNTSKRHKKPSLQNPDKRSAKAWERERDASLITRLQGVGRGESTTFSKK